MQHTPLVRALLFVSPLCGTYQKWWRFFPFPQRAVFPVFREGSLLVSMNSFVAVTPNGCYVLPFPALYHLQRRPRYHAICIASHMFMMISSCRDRRIIILTLSAIGYRGGTRRAARDNPIGFPFTIFSPLKASRHPPQSRLSPPLDEGESSETTFH